MEKPAWMIEHEQNDRFNFDLMQASLSRIEATLKPISETYTTASLLGKWLVASAVFVSIIVGTILSLKSLLGR